MGICFQQKVIRHQQELITRTEAARKRRAGGNAGGREGRQEAARSDAGCLCFLHSEGWAGGNRPRRPVPKSPATLKLPSWRGTLHTLELSASRWLPSSLQTHAKKPSFSASADARAGKQPAFSFHTRFARSKKRVRARAVWSSKNKPKILAQQRETAQDKFRTDVLLQLSMSSFEQTDWLQQLLPLPVHTPAMLLADTFQLPLRFTKSFVPADHHKAQQVAAFDTIHNAAKQPSPFQQQSQTFCEPPMRSFLVNTQAWLLGFAGFGRFWIPKHRLKPPLVNQRRTPAQISSMPGSAHPTRTHPTSSLRILPR